MIHFTRRRNVMFILAAAAASPVAVARAVPAKQARFAALERRYGGRLGVAALDTGSGRFVGHRADERFAMCSTFKLLLAAAVLGKAGKLADDPATLDALLARHVPYGKEVLVTHSPITAKSAGQGLPVGALCDATIRHSDNAAANLLLDLIGGPPAFTAYARSLGDTVTRLDRSEPALNTALGGDPRDTTSPRAMMQSLKRVVLGDHPAREHLTQWLVANTTGGERIRAGVPWDWTVGDKTGTGENGATNDIAVLWPKGRAPIVLALYSVGVKGTQARRNQLLAEAAEGVVAEMKV